jgi:hypothetical protein
MEWANLPVSAVSQFLCNSLSKTDLAKPWKSTSESDLSKTTRYPRALRETGSKLFQPQLHSKIGRYTSAYIRKPADEFDAIFSWTTENLTEFKLSVKNQTSFRGLNNLPNVSQCQNTSWTQYFIAKITLFSPMNSKSCEHNESSVLKNHWCSIPGCHRQQLSRNSHRIHGCLNPGKCLFHGSIHIMSSQQRLQLMSCKTIRWNYIQWQNYGITRNTATHIQLFKGLESPLQGMVKSIETATRYLKFRYAILSARDALLLRTPSSSILNPFQL